MIHYDGLGNATGTVAEWQEFYKWAKERNPKLDMPFLTLLEEYIDKGNPYPPTRI